MQQEYVVIFTSIYCELFLTAYSCIIIESFNNVVTNQISNNILGFKEMLRLNIHLTLNGVPRHSSRISFQSRTSFSFIHY